MLTIYVQYKNGKAVGVSYSLDTFDTCEGYNINPIHWIKAKELIGKTESEVEEWVNAHA